MKIFPRYTKGRFDYLVPGAISAFVVTYLYVCLMRFSSAWSQLAQFMRSSGYDHVAILRFAANALLGRGAGVFIVPGVIALCITIYGVRRRSWWKSVILFAVCLLVGSLTVGGCIRGNSFFNKRSTLRLRVVNPEGVPISGARVTGDWSSSRGWSSMGNGVSPFRGTTNVNGEFSQSTSSTITVEVRATGYYPTSRSWWHGQVPQNPVTIIMKRAPQAVPMFDWVRVASWWKEWRDQFSFGVSIAPAPPTKLNVTEERDKSDLWFEITTEDALEQPKSVTSDDDDPAQVRRNWSMSIYALHGWQIAPGPPAPTGEEDDPDMRYAPKSGYVSELHFDTTENLALFLHHSSSDRYGKAYDLEFRDRSYPGIGNYSFHVEGLVQEENSGTTSLYPMSYQERRERDLKAQAPTAGSGETTK